MIEEILLNVANGIRSVHLFWDPSKNQNFESVEIWRADKNSRDASTKVGESSNDAFIDISVKEGMTYYYWILSKNNSLMWNPSDSGNGVEIITDIPIKPISFDITDIEIDSAKDLEELKIILKKMVAATTTAKST
jgi:hypothetical protein